MLTFVRPGPDTEMLVRFEPAREAIVSWDGSGVEGGIELRVYAQDGRVSEWLPYVVFDAASRRSLGGRDAFVRIDTDVVRADADIVGLRIRARGAVTGVAVSTPFHGTRAPAAALPEAGALPELELEVPAISQYVREWPAERGWCAPASLAMLLAYRGCAVDLGVVARGVYDEAYRGTGNWAFNVAFAGTLGFRGAVVHLRDLEHAHAFLAADVPLALSISWSAGALPGAPLENSDGHLVVLCGIDASGEPVVNDPAQPSLRVRYPRAAFERAWRGHGGIALAIVPAPLAGALLRLANV